MGNCLTKEEETHPPTDVEPRNFPPTVPSTDNNYEPPPTTTVPSVQEIYVAMYQYDARGFSELSFSKGDKMMVLDKSDQDWWKARLLETNQEGFVPMLYIQLATSLESQEWYFGRIDREEVHQVLMSPFNGLGSFLIRESKSGHGYTLSVRAEDDRGGKSQVVKHYRIPKNRDGYPYLILDKPFYTLHDLVFYYRNDGSSVFSNLLKQPCKRNKPILPDISKDTKDRWEIDRESLRFIKKKGQGSFGEVWLGSWNNNVEVAIKTLKEGTMTVEAFMAEAQIMKGLKHPNILVLYAVCTLEEPILIVTEYMSEGSLLDYLREGAGKDVSFTEQLYMATQVASGMAYLEEENLIHRDLAARNVLVGPSLTCKVADFGLARALEGDCYSTSAGKCPVKWTAPEALMHSCFTIKSDVWSYGILVVEILTKGVVPYPGMSKNEVLTFTANGGRMNKPANCPDALYELIYKCWLANPYDRPTFAYITETLSNYDIVSERSYAQSWE